MVLTNKTTKKRPRNVPPASEAPADDAPTTGDQAITTGNGQPGLTIITAMLTDEQRREYRPVDLATGVIYLKNEIEKNKIRYPKDEPAAKSKASSNNKDTRRSKRLKPNSDDSGLIELSPVTKKGPKQKKKSSSFKARADSFKRELRSSKKHASSPLAKTSKPKRSRPSTKT